MEIFLIALCMLASIGATYGALRLFFSHEEIVTRLSGVDTAIAANAYGDTGTHARNAVRRVAEADFTGKRHRLVKRGAADNTIDLCGASDVPIGICIDEPAIGESATVLLLGPGLEGTLRGVVSEAVTQDELLYTAADGKIQDVPTAPGTYYQIGRAVQPAAADDDPLELVGCFPVSLTVS